MRSLFSTMPKWLIAFLAIAGGMAYIILNEPPHSVCDSQLDVFKKSQQTFLFLDPKQKSVKTSKYVRLREYCKSTNNPGGCYELFQELKTMIRDVQGVPSECTYKVGGLSEVRQALWETAELLVRLGWGERPPATYYAKFGWLDRADISFFCSIKARIVDVYGNSQWENFRERVSKSLPGSQQMARNQVWEMSLFSENCARYP